MSMKAELGGMSSGARGGSERGLLGTWKNQKAQEERAGEESCRGAWLEDQPHLRSGQTWALASPCPRYIHSWAASAGTYLTDSTAQMTA